MALKATIFKADLQIADLDRHYYADHALTIARHPSETDERMMMRVLAFALHAGERLQLCKGLSDDDEPDLWQKDLTGVIETWIEIGLPDERRLLKAAGRAKQVLVYAYGGTVPVWWKQLGAKIERASNISVFQVAAQQSEALASLAQRSMRLQCTVQEQQVWLADGAQSVLVEPVALRQAAAAGQSSR